MACNDIFGNTRFIDYKPTSLERNYKYEILTEHDLGVAVDLILPDAYSQQVNLSTLCKSLKWKYM